MFKDIRYYLDMFDIGFLNEAALTVILEGLERGYIPPVETPFYL